MTRYIQSNMNLRDADLVYAQFLIHEGYVGAIVRKRTGIPLVSIALGDDVHAWPEKNPGIIPFLKKALYGADLLLANSRALAQDTENWADDAHPLRVQVMYQGIDLEKFQPLKESESLDRLRRKFGLETSDYYLLCVATPVKLKGWLNLLDSIRELGDQFIGWQFLMVAPKRESPDALDLEEEAERRGIGRSVKHLGKVDHTCMPDLMRAVDAFVLPSYNEGLSNAVLEAMASGTPVIATNVGGHREFIESGVNGILVQPNNTSQLKDALLKLVQDNKFRADIALQARTGAQTIGTYEENAIKLLEVFKSLLGQK